MRIMRGVERGPEIAIKVDGETVTAFTGETIAAAMLAAGSACFRVDGRGQARGLYCNMGTCSECMVWLCMSDSAPRRVRACLIPAEPGQQIFTRAPGHD